MTKKIRLSSDIDADESLEQYTSLDKKGYLDRVGDVFPSDVFPKDWSPVQIERGQHQLLDRRFSSGLWSKVPRICAQTCPFHVNNTCKLEEKPYGSQCPEESLFMELLLRRYMEQLNVEEQELSALSMIRDLCDIELLIMRKQGVLANQELILEEPIMDARGNPTGFTRMVENPLIGTQEKLFKRKHEILQKLLATRESKVKALGDLARTSEMSQAAAALKKLNQMMNEGKAVDGNFDPTYKDEFIEGVVNDDDDEM